MHLFKKTLAAAAAAIFALSAASAFAAEDGKPLFKITIPMETGASVTATEPSGAVHEIGTVVALPVKTRWPSYTASAWGEPGAVCASAVNAVHLLVSVEKGQGRTMSVIPVETIAPAAGPGASIVLSTKAGYGMFGAWAPSVGSKAEILSAKTKTSAPLGPDNLPQKGDTLTISVTVQPMPYMVEIENRPGGRVTEWTSGGCSVIGRVLHTLGGTGRFEGTMFQRTGAIRANHCGVIDVSTSPYGKIGGFQISPWDHALSSKEMQNAWNMTQWLFVGPADGSSKMGATFPLFRHALTPGPAYGEKLWDVWSTYGRKSLVTVRLNGGEWQKMPESAGRADNALASVTHIRIYYPTTEEPQKR